MGIYNALNESYLGTSSINDVIADESYSDSTAGARALLESVQNDRAMFDALIAGDFSEAKAMHEGAINESDIMVLTEGTVRDIWDKIVAGLKKVWSKIKGIFQSFLAKMDALITKDNKELYKKYSSEFARASWDKRTFKFRKRTNNEPSIDDFKTGLENLTAAVEGKTAEQVKTATEDYKDEDNFLRLLGQTIGNNEPSKESEYQKEMMDYMFEDIDKSTEGKDIGTSYIIKIMSTDYTIAKVKRDLAQTERKFTKAVKDAEREQRDKTKAYTDAEKANDGKKSKGKDDDGNEIEITAEDKQSNRDNANLDMLKADYAYTKAVTDERVCTKFTSAKLACVKFEYSQARAVFMKVVSGARRGAKNESSYDIDPMDTFIDEACEFEVESHFDDEI